MEVSLSVGSLRDPSEHLVVGLQLKKIKALPAVGTCGVIWWKKPQPENWASKESVTQRDGSNSRETLPESRDYPHVAGCSVDLGHYQGSAGAGTDVDLSGGGVTCSVFTTSSVHFAE